MNLVDALASSSVNQVIELSLSPCFKRHHHSIARAIQDYPSGRNSETETIDCSRLALDLLSPNVQLHHSGEACHFLALDVTPRLRPYAKKLPDRKIVHNATPTPGQKPIGVGYGLSCIGSTSQQDHWFLPLLLQRVPTDESEVIFGLKQAESVSKRLCNKSILIAADAKYSNRQAIIGTFNWKNKSLLTRLSSTRTFYHLPMYDKEDISKKGIPKKYGKKVKLNQLSSTPDDTKTVTHLPNNWTVSIDRFDHLVMKNKGDLQVSDKTVSVFRLAVKDSKGKCVYKEPLWLMGCGQSIKSIDLEAVFICYHNRYDIEHWFRSAKQHLLLNQYQTCELSHADNWLLYPVLATHQLYLARESVNANWRPWEKPTDRLSLPQVKRGMQKLLDEIGTPAKEVKTRGIGQGRTQPNKVTRLNQEITFKSTSKIKEQTIIIKLQTDDLSGLSQAQLKAQNLPNCGDEIKSAIGDLLKTGKAELELVSSG